MKSFRKYLTAGAGAALALASAPAIAETPADTLVVAQSIGTWTSIDAAKGGDGNMIATLLSVCDTLVKRGGNDQYTGIEPGLAESWEVSDDNKVVTFKLRQGLTFPGTGNPFTAKDILYNIHRLFVANAGRASDLVQFGITADTYQTAITAPDDYTVRVELPNPVAIEPFLFFVFGGHTGNSVDTVEVQKHEVAGDGALDWMQGRTACIGPYRADNVKLGEAVSFVRNDDYWGEKPSLLRLLLINVPESGTQRLMLERGDADVAMNLNPTDLHVVNGTDGLWVQSILSQSVILLSVLDTDPVLGNPLVTQALKHLIDYDALVDTVLSGSAIKRHSFVPLGSVAALDETEGAPFSLDLEKAKALITEVGYPDGFSFKLLTRQEPGFPEIAQHLQQNAAQIGINIEVEVMPTSNLTPLWRSRDFQAVITNWGGQYPDADSMASRYAFNPDNSAEANNSNFPSWRGAFDAEAEGFNALTLAARVEPDPEKRVQLYKELQIKWMNEAPFGILFQQQKSMGLSKRVSVLPQSPLIADYFKLAVKN